MMKSNPIEPGNIIVENDLQVIEELNELRNLVAAVKSQKALASTRGEQLIFLSNALESLSEMIIITDLDHTIIYVNAASEQILGYNPEEMIGHKAAEFFEGIPGNPPNLVEQASRDGVNGVWKGDILNRKKDGKLINVHLSLTWLFDEDNIPTGCVGVTTDITGRMKMEEELLEAKRALEELKQIKNRQVRKDY